MRIHRSPFAWAVLLSVTVLLTPQARAVPALPIILVDQNQALFGMVLPPVGQAPTSSAKSNEKRAGKTMNQLSTLLVKGDLAAKFPTIPSAHTAKLVDKLFTGILGVQTKAAGRTPGRPLSLLSLYATVTIPTLAANDTMSLQFALGGNTYTTQLTQHATLDTKNGTSLLVDYSELPPASAIDGSVVAAYVRATGAPTVGFLVVVLADSNLIAPLSGYGATNADQSGTTVTIPYGVSITGSVSGEHHTGTPACTDEYYAKQGLLGIGVPDSMAAQAESLMTHIH